MYQPPYMTMYVRDFQASTVHLTFEEEGIYHRLLYLCWVTPGCSIPDDPKWISRRLRCHIECYHESVDPIIKEFFRRENGRVFCDWQREKYHQVCETYKNRAEAGAKGGRPRKALKDPDSAKSRAKAGRKPDLCKLEPDKSTRQRVELLERDDPFDGELS